jgi:hypothetical protein
VIGSYPGGSYKYVLWSMVGPTIFAYRLFDPVLGISSPTDVTLVGEARSDEHPCLVIETLAPGQRGNSTYRWYLATDCGYRPVKYEVFRPDKQLSCFFVMTYERDPEVVWRLVAWRRVLPDSLIENKAPESDSVLNQPIEAANFDAVFPPGTSVWNKLTGVESVVPAEGAPIKPETPMQPADAALEELVRQVAKETGPAPVSAATRETRPAGFRGTWVICLAGSVLLLVALLVLFKARSRSREKGAQ